jgi:hypothetical protein
MSHQTSKYKEKNEIPLFILSPDECPLNYFNSFQENQIIHQALLQYGMVLLRKGDSTDGKGRVVDDEASNQNALFSWATRVKGNLPSCFSVRSQRLAQLQSSTRERQREMNGVTLFLTSRKSEIVPRDVLHPTTGGKAFENACLLYRRYCLSVKSIVDLVPVEGAEVALNKNSCISCGKSIKRHAKVRCSLCHRQIHTACLGKEQKVTKTPKGNIWYCDWCLCACEKEQNAHADSAKQSLAMNWEKLREKTSEFLEKVEVPSTDYAALEAMYWDILEDEVDGKQAFCSQNLILKNEAFCYGESQMNESKQDFFQVERNDESELQRTKESPNISLASCSTKAQSIFYTNSWSLNQTFACSFHFLMEGSAKRWYSIAPSQCSSFYRVWNSNSSNSLWENMLNPFKLPEGFKFTSGLQFPGDVVVIHPLAWHSCFALGTLLSSECSLKSSEMWLSMATSMAIQKIESMEFSISSLTNALFVAYLQAQDVRRLEISMAIEQTFAIYLQVANEFQSSSEREKQNAPEDLRPKAGTGNCNVKIFSQFPQKCSHCRQQGDEAEHLAFECNCHGRIFCFYCAKTASHQNECLSKLVLCISKQVFDWLKEEKLHSHVVNALE